MAISFKSNTTRVRRQCMACHDVRILRRLIGELTEIHVLGARSFIGIVTAVDDRSRLLQVSQLADNRGVIIRIDSIIAIEQGRTDEVWSLVHTEVS